MTRLYPKFYIPSAIHNIPMPGTQDDFHMPIFDQTTTVLEKLQFIIVLMQWPYRPKNKKSQYLFGIFIVLIGINDFGNARPFPLSLACTNSRRK